MRVDQGFSNLDREADGMAQRHGRFGRQSRGGASGRSADTSGTGADRCCFQMSTIVAPFKAKLDALVAANKLSAATESTILAHLTTRVTAAVNGQWHLWWWHHA